MAMNCQTSSKACQENSLRTIANKVATNVSITSDF